MKASWFKKHGFTTAQRDGGRELVWKPFTPGVVAPRWIPPLPVPAGSEGHVDVVAFKSGWCPAANLVYERARRAADELGDAVHFTSIDTSDRETFVRFGHTDEVFVDGRPLQRGKPPSYRTVKRRLRKRTRTRAGHRGP